MVSEKVKLQRLLAKASQHAGVKLDIPDETVSDVLAEAQAVADYIDAPETFKRKTCANCGDPFAYKWARDSISTCSVQCMRLLLESKGLKWDPTRSQESRWGRPIPQVVPASALRLIEDQCDNSEVLTDPLQYTLF